MRRSFNKIIIVLFFAGCTYIGPGRYHIVKKGETLWSLSRAYGVKTEKIVRANSRIENPKQIREGQKIYIPGATHERKGKRNEPVTPDTEFIWPARGDIVQKFGKSGNKRSLGIGIKALSGTPVVASASGKVIFESKDFRSYGKIIIIEHKGNYATVYAHNSQNYVRKGDSVKKGEKIALTGSSGWASQPYLYFEIRYKEEPRNPLFFLP